MPVFHPRGYTGHADRPRAIETEDVSIGLWCLVHCHVRIAYSPLLMVIVYPPHPLFFSPVLPAWLRSFLVGHARLCVGDKRTRAGAVDAVAQAVNLSSSEAMQAAKGSVLDKLEGACGSVLDKSGLPLGPLLYCFTRVCLCCFV